VASSVLGAAGASEEMKRFLITALVIAVYASLISSMIMLVGVKLPVWAIAIVSLVVGLLAAWALREMRLY
jgi:hypothetical protein